MSSLRHIAFGAVLFACLVMMVHAVVPHHHRASDLAVCTESLHPCEHALAVTPASESTCALDSTCCQCHGVTCAVSRPFTLRDTADEERSVKPVVLSLLQHSLLVVDRLATVEENPLMYTASGWWITDTRLLACWTPTTLAGRAPPFLLFS